MDKYKSTEKLLATINESPYIMSDINEGVDNMNYVVSSSTEVPNNSEFDININTMKTQENSDQAVPNFVLGSYDPRRRPVSMYEPWNEFLQPDEYTSLPPDLINTQNTTAIIARNCWEAEDAEFITTLDETTILDIESYENIQKEKQNHERLWSNQMNNKEIITVSADVHQYTTRGIEYEQHDDIGIYATIRKQSKKQQSGLTDTEMQIMVTSGGPVEKIPKIMTASCYGALNTSTVGTIDDTPRQQQCIVSMTNSIVDGYPSSMNSSTFEPNSLISSVEVSKDSLTIRTATSDKARVKWWDENNQAEIQKIADQGKCFPKNFFFLYFNNYI